MSFTLLQDMIALTPGNLIIHLRKLEEADYISSEKNKNGTVSITTSPSPATAGQHSRLHPGTARPARLP